MKRCPFCAEEIQEEAIKCRFCGEFLKKRKWWKKYLVGCLVIFIISIILIILLPLFIFLILKLLIFKLFFIPEHLPQYNLPLSPFSGLEYMLRNFAEYLRSFWDRLMDLFKISRHWVI